MNIHEIMSSREEGVSRGVPPMALTDNEDQRMVERGSYRPALTDEKLHYS